MNDICTFAHQSIVPYLGLLLHFSALARRFGNDTAQEQLTQEALSKALHITIRTLNSLKHELQQEKHLVSELSHELQSTQSTLSEYQNKAKTSALDVAAFKLQLQSNATDIVRLSAELDAHAASLAQTRAELASAHSGSMAWKQRADTFEKEARALSLEIQETRHAKISATSDLQTLRSRLEDCQKQAEEYQRRFLAERYERRRLHEELQCLRGNIRVICRVRPPHMLMMKTAPSTSNINNNDDDDNNRDKKLAITFPDGDGSLQVTLSERRQQEYEFSHVLQPHDTQEHVYESSISSAIQSYCDGFNVTILAYGPTGSGKTHTVIGTLSTDPGIAPRAFHAIFDMLTKESTRSWSIDEQDDSTDQYSDMLCCQRQVSVSMLEIYNEQVRDLLQTDSGSSDRSSSMFDGRKVLDVCALGIFSQDQLAAGAERVPGRLWIPCQSPQQAIEVLARGSSSRATASTRINTTSSRSHLVLSIKLQDPSNEMPSTVLNIVDLAGSERVAKSEATGLLLKEANAINKSLSALGDVISAIASRTSSHVPFRNSRLTQVLQDSLGGSSKVLLVCCVSPEIEYASETISTLTFAQRAEQAELGLVVKVPSQNPKPSQLSVTTRGPTETLRREAIITMAGSKQHAGSITSSNVLKTPPMIAPDLKRYHGILRNKNC